MWSDMVSYILNVSYILKRGYILNGSEALSYENNCNLFTNACLANIYFCLFCSVLFCVCSCLRVVFF